MILLVLVLFVVRGVLGIRLVKVDIPSVVLLDDSFWLNCTYDLEGDELYAVKWYKNDVEFYRFLPRELPAIQQYELSGVFVDPYRSSEGYVFLYKTDLETEGIYRCEVSAEAPSFQTVREESNLHVHVIPNESPKIHGVKEHYDVGELVNVTCASGPARPPPVLKWFINDIEAPSEYLSRSVVVYYPDSLQSTLRKLSFLTKQSHFQREYLSLRCTAVYSQPHAKLSEEIIIGDRGLKQPSGFKTDEGPNITGGQESYHVGDMVRVNCSSWPTSPPAELQWLINQKAVKNEDLIRYPPVKTLEGQEVSVLGLNFIAKEKHFQRGEMRLKCTATVSQVITTMSSEETVKRNRHQTPGLLVSHYASKSDPARFSNCVGGLVTYLILCFHYVII